VWGVGRHEARVTEVQVGLEGPGPELVAVTVRGSQPGRKSVHEKVQEPLSLPVVGYRTEQLLPPVPG